MEGICFKSVIPASDGHHTLKIYKTLKGSIATKNIIKLLQQVIDFYEVGVYNWDIFTYLLRSSNRQWVTREKCYSKVNL